MFSKEFGAKAGAAVRNKYQIQKTKTCKGQHRCFPVNVAKFLRIPILENICERLLLKSSAPAANLAKGGIS